MISTSTGITFAEIHSSRFGILVAHIDIPNYQIGVNSEIIFDKPIYSNNIYIYGTNNQLLEFNLQFFKENGEHFSVHERMEINSWLYTNGFEDLIFSNPDGLDTIPSDACEDIVFECKVNGKIESIDYGGLCGISIPFICSKPYPTTRTTVQYLDARNIGTTPTLLSQAIVNRSNITAAYFWDSEMTIKLANGVTSVILKNVSDGGRIVSFTGCVAGDTIYMHNRLGELTAISTSNICDKWNKNQLRMVNGWNHIEVTGACEITINARYPIII